jgi:dTDP-4-dehydrorhamnose reductase
MIRSDRAYKALISEGANVVVITRPNSSSTKTFPGAKVIPVELTDVPALVVAFTEHNIEVVISTINFTALDVSHVLLLCSAL